MLREQVVTPRGGRAETGRGSVTTKGRAGVIVQRPTARGGAKAKGQGAPTGANRAKSKGGAWGVVRAWAPLVGKLLVAVCAGLVLFKGYRAAASSTFFELRSVDVAGVSQASEDQIRQIVRRGAASAGVWGADLAAISSEIERQPWVRDAVVTRVLPSGLRVRITERVPRVVVRTNSGRFVWVDDDGVAVGSLAPNHHQPAFFLRGWDESGADAARAANRERVEKFMELEREWSAAGLSSRVSEVNLDDLRDVRAQLSGDDSQIEVRLGREDLTKRLRLALETLDGQRQTPRGAFITYVDMTQGKRAVVGFNPSARQTDATSGAGEAAATAATSNGAAGAANETASPANAANSSASAPAKKESAQRESSAQAEPKSAAAKKSAEPRRTEGRKAGERAAEQSGDGAGRPRRVGKSG